MLRRDPHSRHAVKQRGRVHGRLTHRSRYRMHAAAVDPKERASILPEVRGLGRQRDIPRDGRIVHVE